ncbi:AAA domain-containing protein [Tenacibaculum finnmarkense genomovar ulcerans]|uniref:McrB family protein n=1 Tax=Tenacibaculum finnmarkense TaxID=2781243 RepID=UPI00187B86A8|nr:AAA family ATPase [Tenacibaculum finnmarkense]MBE7645417.1 AAA domain-containing protein [Tenacibaculum finnmarkense genomovar ulcerans]
MNFWSIQMNQPNGRTGGNLVDPNLMLKNHQVIGTGNWDDIQCRYFTGDDHRGIKIGDIILVRTGKNPVALCEVTSDCYEDGSLKQSYLHDYYRKVKVLDYTNKSIHSLLKTILEDYDTSYIISTGTLSRALNDNATTFFIKSWYKRVKENLEMNKLKELLHHKKQIILQGPPGTGKTRLAKQIASEMTISENNFKVIQFHPSYTYEDFVRGISVKNNQDGNIEYKTENKVLAKIAKEALKNYTDSQKETESLSKELNLKEYFTLFVDFIEDKIEENNGFFKLTDNVGLLSSDEDAFRYKGKNDGWTKNGNRMLFKDILQAFTDENTVRQDLKKNPNLSGLAKQHASYFVRILNMFQEFFKDEKLTFENTSVEKVALKNYVLIIDEINRANLSSVLGELIYALEYRGEAVESMYDIDGNRKITLPPNLYIIGTMNTADRSVGQIDYAIRRRFAFIDVLPEILEESTLENDLKFNTDSFNEVEALFVGDNNHLSDEFKAKDVQLGHSYFIYKEANFDMNLKYEIKPILQEYVADGILKESALELIEALKSHL